MKDFFFALYKPSIIIVEQKYLIESVPWCIYSEILQDINQFVIELGVFNYFCTDVSIWLTG